MKSLHLQQSELIVSSITASFSYMIKAPVGADIYLLCNLPPSSQVKANALWFKVTDGRRTQLNLEETVEDSRVERRYPLDHDQSIIIRQTVMEDAGTYHCESADGQKLSSIYISVEGGCGSVNHR